MSQVTPGLYVCMSPTELGALHCLLQHRRPTAHALEAHEDSGRGEAVTRAALR